MLAYQQSTDGGAERLVLIPQPVTVRYDGGSAALGAAMTIVMDAGIDESALFLAEQLAGEYRRATGGSADIRRSGAVPDSAVPEAVRREPDNRERPGSTGADMRGAVVTLAWDADLGDEEYAIDVRGLGAPVAPVAPGGEDSPAYRRAAVELRGGGPAGLRDGVQTLRQILRQSPRELPLVHIRDHPAFAVRAYSLDVTRGRVPTMGFLTWFVDQLAFYKYNQFQLYVEHAFAFGELSEAWRGTDPLTADDIVRLDDYCARRGIELVPSLATFGHMYMNLRTRTHRRLGEFPDDADRPFSFVERMEHHTLNAADPEALAFAQRLIREYAPLFRSRSFNIGGDETFDLGRGQSARTAPGASAGELYAGFVKGLCDTLGELGLHPMLWADIALESPGTMELLPGNITMLNWMYDPDINEDSIAAIERQGRRQFVCPAVRAWSRFVPDYEGAWLNTYRMAAAGRRHGAEGIVITDWGDYGHVNDPRLSLPGLCYGAQNAWNPVDIGADAMNARISRLVYRDASGRMMGSLSRTGDGASFPWDLAVQVLELDAGGGVLNADVAAYVERSYGGVPIFDRALDCADARRRLLLLNRERITTRPERNGMLADCGEAIVAALAGESRSGLAPSLVWTMLDAQQLFNRLGEELLAMAGDSGRSAANDAAERERKIRRYALAEELERWFERYRAEWLATGRYAELNRNAHVVWSFADILRAGTL